eukprot:3730457-Alexandrium_andersonii.AAC.1
MTLTTIAPARLKPFGDVASIVLGRPRQDDAVRHAPCSSYQGRDLFVRSTSAPCTLLVGGV